MTPTPPNPLPGASRLSRLWELLSAPRPSSPEPAGQVTRVGDLVVAMGWITQDQLSDALREQAGQAEGQEPLGQIFVRRGWLTSEQLAYVLALAPGGRPDPMRLRRIGRFEIKEELGRGGMATVYRAYDTQLRRDVALKFPMEQTSDARWLREARAAARLSYPGIVPVFDVVEQAGLRFLAMEFIEGLPLQEAWEGWGLRPRVECVEQAARAAAYAHSQGIIHRDLKPENLLVDRDKRVKVTDFGLARIEGEASVTLTGTIMGTPAYMSPEQVRGEKVGPAADVYALGAVLYEALTDRPPFLSDQAHEVYAKILSEDPPRPRRLRPGVPRELEIVCLKALGKEPSRRYASAQEFADELRRWLTGEPIRARPPTWTTRIARRVRRNPWAWAGVTAALLAVASGIFAVVVLVRQQSHRTQASDLVREAALEYAGGRLDRVRESATRALALVPEHGEAKYWLARLRLREYQAARPMPDVRIVLGTVEVLPAIQETPEQGRAREEIRQAFRGVPGAILADGVLRLWDGDFDGALSVFEQANAQESAPFVHWELDLLAAQALYYKRDFAAAEEKLKRWISYDPVLVAPVWAKLMLARGLEARLRGENAALGFEQAEAAGLRLKEAGREADGRVLMARAQVEWGMASLDTGIDPEERYERALRGVEGLDGVEACLVRGDALLARAEFRRTRGRLDLENPTEYQEAIDAFSAAVEAAPREAAAFWRRAEARRARWEFRGALGRQTQEDIDGVQQDYAQVLTLNEDYVEAAIGLAWTKGLSTQGDLADLTRIESFRQARVDALSEVVDSHPSYPPARVARGTALIELGFSRTLQGRDPSPDYQAAIEDFSAAIHANESFVLAYVERAHARGNVAFFEAKCGRDPAEIYARAIEDATRALSVNRQSVDAFYERATHCVNRAAYRQTHGVDPTPDYEAAFRDFGEAIRINPAFTKAYMARGTAHANMADFRASQGQDPSDEFAQASEDFSRALAINPALPEAYQWRGIARQNLAALEEGTGKDTRPALRQAIADFDQAIALHPSLAEAYCYRGVARQNLAHFLERAQEDPCPDYEQAINNLHRATEIDPRLAEGYMWLGVARQNLAMYRIRGGRDASSDLEVAIGDLRESVRLNASAAMAWMYLGRTQHNLWVVRPQDRPLLEDSLASLTRAVGLNPSDGETRYVLGLTLLDLGRAADAVVEFETAIRLNPPLESVVRRFLEEARRQAAQTDF